MNILRILALVVFLITAVAPAAFAHSDESVHPGVAVVDALVVRPIGLGLSLATTGIYLGTVPLTFLTGVSHEAGDALVSAPWWYTVGRDVGRFDQGRP